MTTEEVECSLCGQRTTEYCSTLACRACHKSITFEDCVNGTTPDELEWKERKAKALAAYYRENRDMTGEAAKQEYFTEYVTAGGRRIRGLTLAGFNLVRNMVGLEQASPASWLLMTPEDKTAFRRETLERATPDLARTLFGPDVDMEANSIEE